MPVVETNYAHCDAPVSTGPTPSSPPVDDLNHHHTRMSPIGEKNGVQELRKIISMYLAHVYHSDEKRMGKRKMKNLWDKAPDDWPKDIPFVDPNNGLKEDSGKQLKPKKHDLVPMYNFLRQRYEESVSGTQSIIPANTIRGYMQETTCNQTVPEQGQPTIPTHSSPTVVASNYIGPNQLLSSNNFDKIIFGSDQLTVDASNHMTTEVTDKGFHQSVTDESEVYGYNVLEPREEDDITNLMKTYKVNPDDFQSLENIELDDNVKQTCNFNELAFENAFTVNITDNMFPKQNPGTLQRKPPDLFTACSPKRMKLDPKVEYMDVDMEVDNIQDQDEQTSPRFQSKNENCLIPDFDALFGDNNKPRR